MTLNYSYRKLFLLLIIAILISGCSPARTEITLQPTSTAMLEATLPSPSQALPAPLYIWVDPELPIAFLENIRLPDELQVVDEENKANLTITENSDYPISTWFYALAAPFPTLTDQIASTDLIQFWQNHTSEFPAEKLLLDSVTLKLFSKLWGNPDPQSIQLTEGDQMLALVWEQPQWWALIPFEELQPRWKVVALDENSPIRKDFNENEYLLKVEFGFVGAQPYLSSFHSQYGVHSPYRLCEKSNRQQDLLTTVALTGVTAMVRATAGWMENFGLTYPSQDIRDILIEADITHINNEIPFTPKCPPPYPREDTLVFCSKPKYVELLVDIGTDIVELDGDHFQDWGPEAVLYTMDLYDELGWKTYGGGRNLEEARRPLLITHNGNKFAFLGCNAKEIGYAGANINQPGAFHCDIEWMQDQIIKLKAEGYLPIVTFQHKEYYSYIAHDPQMLSDFRAMADAGAVVISGSQAHQPQSMEFYKDGFLHYGLGNLFFDQYDEGIPTRQAFIDRHVFYNGKYIGVELITIIFVDYARPRPMTEEERLDLLQTIFEASTWDHTELVSSE